MKQFVILMLLSFAILLQVSAKSAIDSERSLITTIEQNQNAPPIIQVQVEYSQPENLFVCYHSGKLLPEKQAAYNDFKIYKPNSTQVLRKKYEIPYGLRSGNRIDVKILYKKPIKNRPRQEIKYSMRY